MKKKLLTLSIILGLFIVLTGCGLTTGDNASETESTEVTTETTDENPETETSETETVSETDWPTGPVNAILHAAAGGDTDFNARTYATYFEEITGQPMIITNMDGSSGVAATENVRQAANDGSTFLFTHTGPLVVNNVSGLIDYTYEAFEVSTIPAIDRGTILVASAQSGLTSMEDIIEKSQAEPESVIFGTEFGNYSHLQVLEIENKADIQFRLADIGSTSDKVTNLLGGRIDLAAITYGSVRDYIETGEMIAIGQFNAEPNENLGDIPTLTSMGIDMVMDKPYIIAFPEGTDQAIIKKMSDIAVEIGENEEYQERLKEGFSQETVVLETEEAIEYLDNIYEEYMQYQDVLQGAN